MARISARGPNTNAVKYTATACRLGRRAKMAAPVTMTSAVRATG
jgi:hypothetical protein